MDENESAELSRQMDDTEVTGHLKDTSKLQSRRGRGFRWNAETGAYTPL